MYIAVIANSLDDFQRWCFERSIRRVGNKYHTIDGSIELIYISKLGDIYGRNYLNYVDISYYNPRMSSGDFRRIENLKETLIKKIRIYINNKFGRCSGASTRVRIEEIPCNIN